MHNTAVRSALGSTGEGARNVMQIILEGDRKEQDNIFGFICHQLVFGP